MVAGQREALSQRGGDVGSVQRWPALGEWGPACFQPPSQAIVISLPRVLGNGSHHS